MGKIKLKYSHGGPHLDRSNNFGYLSGDYWNSRNYDEDDNVWPTVTGADNYGDAFAYMNYNYPDIEQFFVEGFEKDGKQVRYVNKTMDQLASNNEIYQRIMNSETIPEDVRNNFDTYWREKLGGVPMFLGDDPSNFAKGLQGRDHVNSWDDSGVPQVWIGDRDQSDYQLLIDLMNEFPHVLQHREQGTLDYGLAYGKDFLHSMQEHGYKFNPFDQTFTTPTGNVISGREGAERIQNEQYDMGHGLEHDAHAGNIRPRIETRILGYPLSELGGRSAYKLDRYLYDEETITRDEEGNIILDERGYPKNIGDKSWDYQYDKDGRKIFSHHHWPENLDQYKEDQHTLRREMFPTGFESMQDAYNEHGRPIVENIVPAFKQGLSNIGNFAKDLLLSPFKQPNKLYRMGGKRYNHGGPHDFKNIKEASKKYAQNWGIKNKQALNILKKMNYNVGDTIMSSSLRGPGGDSMLRTENEFNMYNYMTELYPEIIGPDGQFDMDLLNQKMREHDYKDEFGNIKNYERWNIGDLNLHLGKLSKTPKKDGGVRGCYECGGYFEGGGYVPFMPDPQYLEGGVANPLPGGATEFTGRTHEDGGIILDEYTEVEDGETMDKVKGQDYFFSNHLKLGGRTFADRHKQLLNAGATQKEIDELADIQEKISGRDKYDLGGERKKYFHGGPHGTAVEELLKAFKSSRKEEELVPIIQSYLPEGYTVKEAFIGEDALRIYAPDGTQKYFYLGSLGKYGHEDAANKMITSLGEFITTSGGKGFINDDPPPAEVVTDGSEETELLGTAYEDLPDDLKSWVDNQIRPVLEHKGINDADIRLELDTDTNEPFKTYVNGIEMTDEELYGEYTGFDDDDNDNESDTDPENTKIKFPRQGEILGFDDIKYSPEIPNKQGAVKFGDRTIYLDDPDLLESINNVGGLDNFMDTWMQNVNPAVLEEAGIDSVEDLFADPYKDDKGRTRYPNWGKYQTAWNTLNPDNLIEVDDSPGEQTLSTGFVFPEEPTTPPPPPPPPPDPLSGYQLDAPFFDNPNIYDQGILDEIEDASYYQDPFDPNTTRWQRGPEEEFIPPADDGGGDGGDGGDGLGKTWNDPKKRFPWDEVLGVGAAAAQLIPAWMAFKEKPDYMGAPDRLGTTHLERVAFNDALAGNAANYRGMSRFIEQSGLGPGGIANKMASWRTKQEGDMKIEGEEARQNAAIANQEAQINQQSRLHNIKNRMYVDEFNRAADAATKDRRLMAVQNAVQSLASMNRDRMMYKAQRNMATAISGQTGVNERFQQMLDFNNANPHLIPGTPEHTNALNEYYLQQADPDAFEQNEQIAKQNPTEPKRRGGLRRKYNHGGPHDEDEQAAMDTVNTFIRYKIKDYPGGNRLLKDFPQQDRMTLNSAKRLNFNRNLSEAAYHRNRKKLGLYDTDDFLRYFDVKASDAPWYVPQWLLDKFDIKAMGGRRRYNHGGPHPTKEELSKDPDMMYYEEPRIDTPWVYDSSNIFKGIREKYPHWTDTVPNFPGDNIIPGDQTFFPVDEKGNPIQYYQMKDAPLFRLKKGGKRKKRKKQIYG